jgi:CRP-like cAMP-binding protein
MSEAPGTPQVIRLASNASCASTGSVCHSSSKNLTNLLESTPKTSTEASVETGTVGQLLDESQHVLKEFGKVPRESRTWGTSDKPSEKHAAEILRKLPEYSRFDEHALRVLCHAAEWRQFRKLETLAFEGAEQEEFFVVISGCVTGRVLGKSFVALEKGDESRPKGNPVERTSEEKKLKGNLGQELTSMYSGGSIGIGALLVGWDTWPMSYTAQTKVEVLAIHRWAISESFGKTLKWSFDSLTLMDVLQSYKKETRAKAIIRSEEWVTKISLAMRLVPYFRQIPQEAVQRLARSVELQEYYSREVMWEQIDPWLTNLQNTSAMLHVVLRGSVWVFKTKDDASKRRAVGVKDVWNLPEQLFAAYGVCVQKLIENDSMGEPTLLAHEYTMIAEPGTVLARIRNPMDAQVLKGSGVLHQHGLVRQLLTVSQRSLLDSQRLNSELVQSMIFFQRMGRTHAAKLLEQATFEKKQKGDILMKQGEEADCLYIILNGLATSYQMTNIVSRSELHRVWSKWEVTRERQDYDVLGKFVQRFGVGQYMGESEVVEKRPFRTSVIADEEMEVIRISATVYTTVMWDLCDGEPLDVDRIRTILALPAFQRSKEDIDEIIDMLDDSDFLSIFPEDLKRQMTENMSLFDCNEGHLIVRQDDDDDSFFLVIFGSVALHKSNEESGSEKNSFNTNSASHLGPCRRVLGVGDSFGELAFVQEHAHPSSAVARSRSTLIVLRRREMLPQTIARILSFVTSPRNATMDSVFEKDLADRNEKDILLLINYLEMNPFLRRMAYPNMVECAHSILRHQVSAGQPLIRESSDSGELTESQIFIVNSGSLQVTPLVKDSTMSVQWQDMPSSTNQPQTFTERLQQSKKGEQRRSEIFCWSGQFLLLSASLVGNEKDKSAKINNVLIGMARPKAIAVDLTGMITYTSKRGPEANLLTQLGHISEISSVQRMTLPNCRSALRISFRGNAWIMVGVFRSECDAFIRILSNFNPYLKSVFRDEFWQEPLQILRGDEWKNISFRITTDGEVLYSSNCSEKLEHHLDSEWLSLGKMQQCVHCMKTPTLEKPWAITIILENVNRRTTFLLNAGCEAKAAVLMNRLRIKCSPQVLRTHFDMNDYGSESLSLKVSLINALLCKTLQAKRLSKSESEQLVVNASSQKKKTHKNSTNTPVRPETAGLFQDDSIFVGYGSAFCVNGKAVANDEGCLLFSLSSRKWEKLKRRQIDFECDKATQLLRGVAWCARASKREMQQLALNSCIMTFPIVGEATPCSSLSNNHTHIILEGSCKLRRVARKAKHTDKVRKQALLALASTAADTGFVKNKCDECSGGGIKGVIPPMSQRIKLCKRCNGCGYVLQELDEAYDTEIGELHKGAILADFIARGDSLIDYAILSCTPFQLLAVKLETWVDLKCKWERLVTGQPESDVSMANFNEKLLGNARAVREKIQEHGPVSLFTKSDFYIKQPSLEEKAKRLIARQYSNSMREIDNLLKTPRGLESMKRDVLVTTLKDSRPLLNLAPAKTITNRFAGTVPQLKLEALVADDLREVFLTNMPLTERFFGTSTQESRIMACGAGGSTDRIKASFTLEHHNVNVILPPLFFTQKAVSHENLSALAGVHWRGLKLDVPTAPRVTLKYGNAYALDDRQRRIYKGIQVCVRAHTHTCARAHTHTHTHTSCIMI